MADAFALIRRHLHHPDLRARLETLGEEADLRGDLQMCELDLLGVQMDLDEEVRTETPDSIYEQWERVADVIATVRQYERESA